MPAKGSEIVDVEITIKIERPLSWLVESHLTGNEGWIPKSAGELSDYDESKQTGTMTMPRWMAEEKELV